MLWRECVGPFTLRHSISSLSFVVVGGTVSDHSRRVEGLSESAPSFAAVQGAVSSTARETSTPAFREGLPPNYRMRADAHYVDQLDSPPAITVQVVAITAVESDDTQMPIAVLVDSIRRHGVIEPLIVQKRDRRYRVIAGRKRLAAAAAAGLREVPCIVRRMADEEAQVLAGASRIAAVPAEVATPSSLAVVDEEIARSLGAVLSSTGVLGEEASRLTHEVTIEVMRAEAQRAYCQLRTASILRNGLGDSRRFVAPRDIIQRIADLVAADARLRGITVTTSWIGTERSMLNVHAEALSCALSAVALRLFSALGRVDAASLSVTASADSAGQVTFAVEQDFVVVPESWVAGALTATAADAPGGHQLVPLIALGQLVEGYGGNLTTSRLAHGTRVSVDLPIVPRR